MPAWECHVSRVDAADRVVRLMWIRAPDTAGPKGISQLFYARLAGFMFLLNYAVDVPCTTQSAPAFPSRTEI
jgi:hypothetical protein